jgi:hypothetical protein
MLSSSSLTESFQKEGNKAMHTHYTMDQYF